MKKWTHYYFDPVTSRYRRIQDRPGNVFLRAGRQLLLSAGIAASLGIGFANYFELPREAALKEEIKELEYDFAKLDGELTSLHEVVSTIEQRDDNLYRKVLGAEPVDKSIRNGGIGGADRERKIHFEEDQVARKISLAFGAIEKLRRKLYVESVSQDEILRLAEEKQKQFAALPAIQPLANRSLTGLVSGFGMRMHPIYKVIMMHTGIDFSSPTGTPVYATADGQVVAADTAVCGFGRLVAIDHGYGYETRYGHLLDIKVKTGEKVKRGALIAWSGNSGISTAPHLHYEVLLNGVEVNPVYYFFKDLSPLEFERIVQLAGVPNQSLGN